MPSPLLSAEERIGAERLVHVCNRWDRAGRVPSPEAERPADRRQRELA